MKKYLIAAMIFSAQSFLAQSVDKQKLRSLLDKAKETNSEAIIIYKDGKLVTESYFGIGHKDTLIEAMSTTKSIAGLAVACLLDDGLLENLDVPVHRFYPEWNQGTKKDITVRHLVNMTSGIQNVPDTSVEIYPSRDFVQLALTAEMSAAPGTAFSYNNKSLNLLSGLIQKITGKRMDHYIGERLFRPMGITRFTWSLDDAGNPHVMSGCQIRPADHVKMGLLVLNKGKYDGKQVIGENFIAQVLEPSPRYQGYGMLWWIDYSSVTFSVGDEVIQPLKDAGISADFVQKLESMRGDYDSDQAFFQKLKEVFGQNPRQAINEALGDSKLEIVKIVYGGTVTYRADGYLGNYIIVNPESGVVGLRMISHKSFRDENDNFTDFVSMVQSL